jgi:hypothetical protein
MPIIISTYCRVNKNGSMDINTDPAFGIITTTTTTTTTTINLNDYACVSGPLTFANGTYLFGGYAGEFPVYNGPNGYFFFPSSYDFPLSPTWLLWNDNNGEPYVVAAGNTRPVPAYPWLETSWRYFYASFVVTQGPC